ncbi:hypothetical protein ACNUDN_01325 [Mycobacterium sp. smrl_JER01]|uniref:hypothetical protein n=1 Tax=Mycobacterium sp. smrl_JER01 TaxID=3402633 RepID=UPI003AD1BF7B
MTGPKLMPKLVLVAGPPRAGVTAMVDELRRRMPDNRFLEDVDEGCPGAPSMVLLVFSAVAAMSESDCALAESVAETTAAVVAVVSKIDDHRDWAGVLEQDRELLAVHAARFRDVPWTGAAASPRLGEPRMDDLVAVIAEQLGDPHLLARNTLHALSSRERLLAAERARLVRGSRARAARRAADRRAVVTRARLAATHMARRRCGALRADLLAEVTSVSRYDMAGFVHRTQRRSAETLAAVEADVTAHTVAAVPGSAAGTVVPGSRGPAAGLELPRPALNGRRLETRLMAVLGAGFGLGVAVVVARFLTGIAPWPAPGAAAVGAVIGALTAAWVIRTRALLHDRAVLERWTAEGMAALRAAVEERVADRMLSIETAILSAGAMADEDADAGLRIAAIEAELRGLTLTRERLRRTGNVLPASRSPGGGHLNRSCE